MAKEATNTVDSAFPRGGADLFDGRIGRLRRDLEKNSLDGIIIGSSSNLFYLSNLRSSAGFLLVRVESTVIHLIIDFRYKTAVNDLLEAGHAPSNLAVVIVAGSYEETLAKVIKNLAVRRLGVEADHMSVRLWRWLSERSGDELVPVNELVERQRLLKDQYEISILRQAGELLVCAFHEALDVVREGSTERAVAQAIDQIIGTKGFERVAFETIVASGPNSALPHAHPTTRSLQRGDLVILDFGGVLEGYCVDMSRTITVGPATPAASRLHQAVMEAQLMAMAAAVPGARLTDVDGAARSVLAKHGLAEKFGHGTGHGLGLDVHELPRVSRSTEETPQLAEGDFVTAGMIFTVEPGVYLPGYGGVRIEDDVLATTSGIDVLTPSTRDLIQV